MLGKKRDRLDCEVTPGPGQYHLLKNEHSQAAIFGTERVRTSQSLYRQNIDSLFSGITSKNSLNLATSYSFGTQKRIPLHENTTARFTPGPGHYMDKDNIIREKPAVCVIPTSERYSDKNDFFEDGPGFLNPSQCFLPSRTNFQEFARTVRFIDLPHYPLFLNSKDGARIMLRNKKEVRLASKDEKRRKIIANKMKLEEKIKAAQEKEEILESERIKIIIDKRTENERRRFVVAEKGRSWKLVRSWQDLATMGGLLSILAIKYTTRKEVRRQTSKNFRLIFFSFLAIGRLIRRLRAFKMCRSIFVIGRVMRTKLKFWRQHKIVKSKTAVGKFVERVEDSPMILLFLKFILSKIFIIQKWYRRVLVKRYLMLAIMNLQWSVLEYAVLKVRASERKNSDLMVAENLKAGKVSEVVPVSIRIQYLRAKLKVMALF